LRILAFRPRKLDWPKPQSVCRNAILGLGETGVCSLVDSF
jgi:hypothetical protein